MLTNKHKRKVVENKKKLILKNFLESDTNYLCKCGKKYKYKQGLWNHRQKCSQSFENDESLTPFFQSLVWPWALYSVIKSDAMLFPIRKIPALSCILERAIQINCPDGTSRYLVVSEPTAAPIGERLIGAIYGEVRKGLLLDRVQSDNPAEMFAFQRRDPTNPDSHVAIKVCVCLCLHVFYMQ